MKTGLIVIIALVIGSVAAHLIMVDAGYVVINYRNTIIEMTIPALIGLLLGIVFLIWLVWKLVVLPRRVGQAVGQIRAERQGSRFTKGLIAAAEGKLGKGERLLTRGAGKAETPLLNYLAAARVAHQQGAGERRDSWLSMAFEMAPDASNAVRLTQAELQMASGEYESALATLNLVREAVPNHPQALLLQAKTFAALEDWQQLAPLLPGVRKLNRVDDATLDAWDKAIATGLLDRAADLSSLRSAWQATPAKLRAEPWFIDRYAVALLNQGAGKEAEGLLKKTLKGRWDGALVRRYGGLDKEASPKALKVLESWLKSRGDDADLLYAAGRVCIRDELWGKARSYLESALSVRPTPEIYQAYGELLGALGEDSAAADAFRSGLSVAAGPDTLQLPRPEEVEPS